MKYNIFKISMFILRYFISGFILGSLIESSFDVTTELISKINEHDFKTIGNETLILWTKIGSFGVCFISLVCFFEIMDGIEQYLYEKFIDKSKNDTKENNNPDNSDQEI